MIDFGLNILLMRGEETVAIGRLDLAVDGKRITALY
jgi:hypothetical protein